MADKYDVGMTVKKVKQFSPKKPAKRLSPKVKLSKSDPDYFKKIGEISAKKRAISSEQFAEWARLSHKKRKKSSYKNGGRRKKDAGTKVAKS